MPQTPKFIRRKTNMTLEKLLIFGFALAALFAITTVGTNMMKDRGTANDEFKQEVDGLKNAGF
jgi:hypothetical protein